MKVTTHYQHKVTMIHKKWSILHRMSVLVHSVCYSEVNIAKVVLYFKVCQADLVRLDHVDVKDYLDLMDSRE